MLTNKGWVRNIFAMWKVSIDAIAFIFDYRTLGIPSAL
jgi:hypothetical protein